MDTLSKDPLYVIALKLDLPDLLKWCNTSSRINNKVCNNVNVWNSKLLIDFPNYDYSLKKSSSRETYTFLYKLYIIKKKLKIENSLVDLYNTETLHINKNIIKIPREIGVLKNLKKLYIYDTIIQEIPTEIGDLINLKELYLSENKLSHIPKEIGNLKKLEELYLNDNVLEELPKELGNLNNLQVLFLNNNYLTELPKELGNLYNLQQISLYGNDIKYIPKEIQILKNNGLKIFNK